MLQAVSDSHSANIEIQTIESQILAELNGMTDIRAKLLERRFPYELCRDSRLLLPIFELRISKRQKEYIYTELIARYSMYPDRNHPQEFTAFYTVRNQICDLEIVSAYPFRLEIQHVR